MSKMYVLVFIFLLNRIINAENSSEEKYIDLLPEKEKEEFLEKIARRIFNGVQSNNNRNGVSGEVSETELNEHSEFVNQILKDESENLRKSGVKDDNDGESNQKKDENKELDKKDVDAADDTQLVDLTLRDNKRDKRNSFKNTEDESKIVRINVSNVEVKEQDQEKTDEDKYEGRDGSDKEDIQIKHFPRSSVKNEYKIETTAESKTTDINSEKEKDDSNETLIASQGNLDESEKDVKSLETKVDNNTDDIENKINEHSTQKVEVSHSDLEESEIDGKLKKKRETKSDDNSDDDSKNNPDNNIKDSIAKNKNEEKIELEENSDEKGAVPLASESTTINEPTTPDVKPTIVQTEKLTIGGNITEADKNTTSKAHFRSDTGRTNMKDEESDLKNVTVEKSSSDNKVDIVSIAVETMDDLDNKEYQTNLDYNKTHLEINRTKSTVSFIDQDHTTDIHTTEKSIDVTTLKTEVLTNAAMRTGIELSNNDNYDKHAVKKDKKATRSRVLKNYTINKERLKSKNEGKDGDKEIDMNINKRDKSDDVKKDLWSLKFANELIKVLKEKLKPDTYTYRNELKTVPLYSNLQPKYNVYEVPIDDTPFIKKHQDDKNKENPYYAPIYNYSPDNAYYNPYNKLGPNADDNKGDIITRIEDEKNNENEDSFNERHDDKVDDKSNSDFSNISIEDKEESSVTDKLKQYSVNKKDIDPNLDRLIKGYTKYKNQRKFKFGNHNHNEMQKSPYKLKLPVVVQHSKFTDIILNPNDYMDMDYIYDKNQEPNIGRCELPTTLLPDDDDTDTKNLKSSVREVRQLLYKQKIFGYIPDKSYEHEDIFNLTKPQDVLRANERSADENKSIAMDYFFGRSDTNDRFDIIDNSRERFSNDKVTHKNENEINPVTPFALYNEELRSNEKQSPFETIREVLSMSDAKDLVSTVDKLMSVKLTRSDKLEPYVTVLEDMVRDNAKGLRQYDWLGTTVDIQSGLLKLMDMADGVQSNIPLSHPDLELLKYTIYLHKSTKVRRKQSRKSKMLPKNRKKIKGFIKESGLLNRHWLFRMMAKKYDTIITSEDFNDFNDFLNALQYYLYDLHTAVQEIANITEYNNQNWFENLKQLHIDTKRKHILEMLLHVTTTRLLDLIENSAKNGVEKDFLTYVINNEGNVNKTKAGMALTQKIMEEIMIE